MIRTCDLYPISTIPVLHLLWLLIIIYLLALLYSIPEYIYIYIYISSMCIYIVYVIVLHSIYITPISFHIPFYPSFSHFLSHVLSHFICHKNYPMPSPMILSNFHHRNRKNGPHHRTQWPMFHFANGEVSKGCISPQWKSHGDSPIFPIRFPFHSVASWNGKIPSEKSSHSSGIFPNKNHPYFGYPVYRNPLLTIC